MGIRPHASSLVVRRPDMAPPALSSISAPHTPTAPHSPLPITALYDSHTQPKLGLSARLKAASFSYKTRPRERSPKVKEDKEGSRTSVANGAPRSFRFRSVTTASFFRSRNKGKKEEELGKESGESNTTKM